MSNSKGFTEADVPQQTGKSFIVTGANAGVGFEIARVLAASGARVLLGCREQTRAQDAIARIQRITPNADLVWLPLDLGDLEAFAPRPGSPRRSHGSMRSSTMPGS
jgi:NAD(P)-dependent dehydrogenase (short-subunit alcohol dehydrogenase family)